MKSSKRSKTTTSSAQLCVVIPATVLSLDGLTSATVKKALSDGLAGLVPFEDADAATEFGDQLETEYAIAHVSYDETVHEILLSERSISPVRARCAELSVSRETWGIIVESCDIELETVK